MESKYIPKYDSEYIANERIKLLRAKNDELVEALKFVQTALANWRDEEDIIHPEHGKLNLEEIKYLIVDEILKNAKA